MGSKNKININCYFQMVKMVSLWMSIAGYVVIVSNLIKGGQ